MNFSGDCRSHRHDLSVLYPVLEYIYFILREHNAFFMAMEKCAIKKVRLTTKTNIAKSKLQSKYTYTLEKFQVTPNKRSKTTA